MEFVAERGSLLEPEAADYLLNQPEPFKQLVSFIESIENLPLIITCQDIMLAEEIAIKAASRSKNLERHVQTIEPRTEVVQPPRPRLFKPQSVARTPEPASNYEEDIVVLKDITGQSTCEGTLEDFSKYFLNRFRTLAGMLRQRRDLASAIDIVRARRLSREVSVIGIVDDVRMTRNGHRILELEDETDRISVLIPASTQLASSPVVTDEVIGVTGTVNPRGLLVASNIAEPDVPTTHRSQRCTDNVSVAFVSDMHVGSKSFLEDRWMKFSKWVANGEELSRSIKYIIMAGDLVDGIGVYPRQDEDLLIDDIYAQYEALAKLISELPSHLRIVLSPGNHDAVRPAEPQPALPDGIRKLMPSNVLCVGNPSMLSIHGVRILAYHGRSMDDLVGLLPNLSYARPLDAMKSMLQMRHLAPVYGGRTPIAPESRDLLVVDEVPDIFVTGHVHGVGIGEYRGVTMINSSAWQSQTSYQKMRNLVPMPGHVPVVNLCTGRVSIKDF